MVTGTGSVLYVKIINKMEEKHLKPVNTKWQTLHNTCFNHPCDHPPRKKLHSLFPSPFAPISIKGDPYFILLCMEESS